MILKATGTLTLRHARPPQALRTVSRKSRHPGQLRRAANASVNLQQETTRLRACEDYELLDDRQVQNRLVKFVIEARKGILVPVRPRQFARAVAQQSILTVSPDIGVGRPADRKSVVQGQSVELAGR